MSGSTQDEKVDGNIGLNSVKQKGGIEKICNRESIFYCQCTYSFRINTEDLHTEFCVQAST